jgi:hypothetical protein
MSDPQALAELPPDDFQDDELDSKPTMEELLARERRKQAMAMATNQHKQLQAVVKKIRPLNTLGPMRDVGVQSKANGARVLYGFHMSNPPEVPDLIRDLAMLLSALMEGLPWQEPTTKILDVPPAVVVDADPVKRGFFSVRLEF